MFHRLTACKVDVLNDFRHLNLCDFVHESKIHDKESFYRDLASNTSNIDKSLGNGCSIIPLDYKSSTASENSGKIDIQSIKSSKIQETKQHRT